MPVILPTKIQKKNLKEWYLENFRPLPWRRSKNPYFIWISETMLQQTTTQAVIPYFERFIAEFPTLKHLAKSPLESVLSLWSGLGYYSRARNLHKAAQHLDQLDEFPQNFQDLLALPGVGPYTSRAVSSLAFGESVGVLDGNVIRVLCRVHGLKWTWWKTKERIHLQELVDLWVKDLDSSIMNQALMELGATICTPKSPSCLLCPLKKNCVAKSEDLITQLPLPKPRKQRVVLHWTPRVIEKRNSILLTQSHGLPFLKSQPMPPGAFKELDKKPKKFDFKHSITHFDIYVQIDTQSTQGKTLKGKWVQIEKLRQINPSSILQKLLEANQRRSR